MSSASTTPRARRRLLLVAFHYPPVQGSSGVHRSLAFSRYLPEFGWDVSVLTVAARAHEKVLLDNLRLIPRNVRVIRAQAWDAARHFAILGRYPSLLAHLDRWSSWIPFAVRAGLREHRAWPCDAIFTTYPIASAHEIGRRLHRRTGLPWVADFRDPMATAGYPYEPAMRKVWMTLQSAVVHEASRVTVTTPGTAEYYRGLYPDISQQHIDVIENGFDPETFPKSTPELRPQRPHILLHSGVLYPRERDPLPFFRALKRLVADGTIAPGTLRVRLRATGFDSEYSALLADMGLSELVELAPPLPYADAVREMQSATGLLLFQASVCDEQIPAKAYEYLYAGRPILGLTSPAGDTGKLLQRFGVPAITALEDEDGILRMLRSSLPQIIAGNYPIPSQAAVMTLSRRSGAERLATQLDALAARERASTAS